MAQTINLKHLHPHSSRYLALLMSPWMAFGMLMGGILVLFGALVSTLPVSANDELFTRFSFITMALFLVAGVGRLLYGLAYVRSYDYVVHNGNLIVSKGVFLKTQGSYPLRRVTDVYIRNDWKTLLFGLYTVGVLTPSRESKDFCHIEGLTHRTAISLKERLLKLIERSDQDQKVQITAPSDSRAGAYARHSLVARRQPQIDIVVAQ